MPTTPRHAAALGDLIARIAATADPGTARTAGTAGPTVVTLPDTTALDTELDRLLGRGPIPVTGTLYRLHPSPYAVVKLLDPVDLEQPAPELGEGATVATTIPAGTTVAVEVSNSDHPRRVVTISGPAAGAVGTVTLPALAASADRPDAFLNLPMTATEEALDSRYLDLGY